MNVRITIDSYPFLRTLRAQISLTKQQQYEVITQLCELIDKDLNSFYNNIRSKLKLDNIFTTSIDEETTGSFTNTLCIVAMELFFKLRELNILDSINCFKENTMFVEHIDDNCLVLNLERIAI